MTSCFIPPGQIHTRDVWVLCLHRVTLRHKPSISCTSIPSNSLIQSSSWNTSLRLDRLVGITPHWLYLKQMLLMSLHVSKGQWASHKPWTLRPYLCLCLRTTRIWYESALLHNQSHCHQDPNPNYHQECRDRFPRLENIRGISFHWLRWARCT